MALTQTEIDIIANPALDRIAAGSITLASQGVKGTSVEKHYEQTRDALLRSFVWPFATERVELEYIQTVTFQDTVADGIFAVGDVLTGVSSGVTGTVDADLGSESYELSGLSGTFTEGEMITNATVYSVVYGQDTVVYGDDEDTLVWFDSSDSEQLICETGYPTQAATEAAYKWAYQYRLPADFLRLVCIEEDDGSDPVDSRWEIEGNRIKTDYDTLNIQYIQKLTDVTLYDALFVELLIAKLATKLVNPLAGTASQQFRQDLQNEIGLLEYRARVIASQENNTSGRTDWNYARYGS